MQASPVAAGVACGPLFVFAADNNDSPFSGPRPRLESRGHTTLEVTAGGELIMAGSSGNSYRFAERMSATNPFGWSVLIKVKNPAGITAGYILLHSNVSAGRGVGS